MGADAPTIAFYAIVFLSAVRTTSRHGITASDAFSATAVMFTDAPSFTYSTVILPDSMRAYFALKNVAYRLIGCWEFDRLAGVSLPGDPVRDS